MDIDRIKKLLKPILFKSKIFLEHQKKNLLYLTLHG